MILIKTKALAIVTLISLFASACTISIPMIPGLKNDGVQVPALEVKVKIAGESEAPLTTEEPADDPTETAGNQESSSSEFASLNYDESDADALTPGQTQLIALYLRDAEAAGLTQEAMEKAVVSIQQEAEAAEATVFEGATLQLNQNQAWLVWCADGSGVDMPTDVSDVFDTLPQGPGRLWIQVPFAEGVPLRDDSTWTGCESFWAVAVH